MSIIKAFKLILTNSTFPNSSPSQLLDNIIAINANCKAITNHMYGILLLNTLQRLVMEGIFDYVI